MWNFNGKDLSMKVLIIFILFFSACSTPPKNPGEVRDLRNQAETQLKLGNTESDRGNYDLALILINEARRLATTSDDPGLRIRSGLSRGNVLFALGRDAEARADWDEALGEAEAQGGTELAAVSRIHRARGQLLKDGADARAIRDEVNREMAAIKSDRQYIAFAWTVIALAEKEQGRYGEAEAAIKRALELHEKDRQFEQAAYDWFLTASFRSLAGNYEGARQALELAIAADRRTENTWGLAADWRALGDVYKKAGKTEESRRAYLRSAEIFRSIGNDEAAEAAEKRIGPAL
jgi:tetratricopeptide (TPR) repeat protein